MLLKRGYIPPSDPKPFPPPTFNSGSIPEQLGNTARVLPVKETRSELMYLIRCTSKRYPSVKFSKRRKSPGSNQRSEPYSVVYKPNGTAFSNKLDLPIFSKKLRF